MSDDHVKELIDEWQIFYPGLSNYDSKHSLPAAVEVVVGECVCMYVCTY